MLENVLQDAVDDTLYKTATEARVPTAVLKTLLESDDTTATACMLATHRVCGGNKCMTWEPESLWTTLERNDIHIVDVNKDKVLAAHTLLINPAFWWEVNAFQNTTMAFNDVLSTPDTVQEATPAQISWAVFEAETIYARQFPKDNPVFDREPTGYTAVCLRRAGFVMVPQLLGFAQKVLNGLNASTIELRPKDIRRMWGFARRSKKLPDTWSEDNAVDVQVARLLAVMLYVEERAAKYKQDLAALSSHG